MAVKVNVTDRPPEDPRYSRSGLAAVALFAMLAVFILLFVLSALAPDPGEPAGAGGSGAFPPEAARPVTAPKIPALPLADAPCGGGR